MAVCTFRTFPSKPNTCIGISRACPRCEHRKGTPSTWAVWKGLSENTLAYWTDVVSYKENEVFWIREHAFAYFVLQWQREKSWYDPCLQCFMYASMWFLSRKKIDENRTEIGLEKNSAEKLWKVFFNQISFGTKTFCRQVISLCPPWN